MSIKILSAVEQVYNKSTTNVARRPIVVVCMTRVHGSAVQTRPTELDDVWGRLGWSKKTSYSTEVLNPDPLQEGEPYTG